MHRAGKQGLGTAYIQAFTKGLGEGYDRFFEMDADLSHDVRYLPDFEQYVTTSCTLRSGYVLLKSGR